MSDENQKPEWQKLMDEDSTLEDYVARYETGETTNDDLYRLAADTLINGNPDSAVEFVTEAINKEHLSMLEAVNKVKEYGYGSLSENQLNEFARRLESALYEESSVSPR
jgi:hypothetical protein